MSKMSAEVQLPSNHARQQPRIARSNPSSSDQGLDHLLRNQWDDGGGDDDDNQGIEQTYTKVDFSILQRHRVDTVDVCHDD